MATSCPVTNAGVYRRRPPIVNTFLLLLFFVAALATGYVLGRLRRPGAVAGHRDDSAPARPEPAPAGATPAALPPPEPVDTGAGTELHRLVRSAEAETMRLAAVVRTRDAAVWQLAEFAEDRRALLSQLAAARAETARYRQLAIDIEDNALPVLFGPATPDDLKLIVGVGPVLERMLHQLGVTSYRQIARWSERDIDEIDARLPEFPGRIRRDAWVTQARALHQSKYGEPA